MDAPATEKREDVLVVVEGNGMEGKGKERKGRDGMGMPRKRER